jgi:hypothetical protein
MEEEKMKKVRKLESARLEWKLSQLNRIIMLIFWGPSDFVFLIGLHTLSGVLFYFNVVKGIEWICFALILWIWINFWGIFSWAIFFHHWCWISLVFSRGFSTWSFVLVIFLWFDV